MRRAPSDDGFIYLAIAQHFPRPEHSAGIATTGFHPLWWLVVTPFVHLLDGLSAVRAVLLLAVVLHLASGAILFVALRQRFEPLAAWGAAATWILLPGARTIVVMGVESSLLACCLALVLWRVLLPGAPTPRRAAAVGAAVGLAYLARTDSPFVTLPLLLAWLSLGRAPWRARVRPFVVAGASGFAVALPWLAYTASQGSLLASDAFRAERQGTSLALFVDTEKRAAAELYLLNALGDLRHAVGGAVSNGALAVAGALLVWALARRRDRVGLAALAGPALLFVAYGALEGYIRDWYLLYPLFALTAFGVPVVVEAVAHRASTGWARAVVGSVLGLSLALPNHALNPQEGDKWLAAPIASELLPADARVGAFNAGIYQYAMRQEVVNLDGVVNPDVLAHRGAGLCDYLVAEGIDHLVDYRLYLDRAQAADARLTFTERVDLTAIASPTGDRVDQRQELVTVDLDACRGQR